MPSSSPIRRSQQLQPAASPSCPASPQPLRRAAQLEMQQQQVQHLQPRLHRSRAEAPPPPAPPSTDLIYRNNGASVATLLGRGDTPRPSPVPESAPSSAAAALAERLRASETPSSPATRRALPPPPPVFVTPVPPPTVKKKRSYSLIKLLRCDYRSPTVTN